MNIASSPLASVDNRTIPSRWFSQICKTLGLFSLSAAVSLMAQLGPDDFPGPPGIGDIPEEDIMVPSFPSTGSYTVNPPHGYILSGHYSLGSGFALPAEAGIILSTHSAPSFSNGTKLTSLVTGSGTIEVSTGPLAGGTTYYYRAYADADQTSGEVRSFTTESDNSAPTNIALGNGTFNQLSGINAQISALNVTDPDSSDTHAFALVDGTGSDSNAYFTISGNFLYAVNTRTTPAGAHHIRIQVTDNSGASFSKALTLTAIDNLPPEQPTVTLNAASDSGIAGDYRTNVNRPTLLVDAELGSTVNLYVSENSGSSVTLIASGLKSDPANPLSFTLNEALADGNYRFHATATDALDNLSDEGSLSHEVVIDTAPPVMTNPTTWAATYGRTTDGFRLSADGFPTTFLAPAGVPFGLNFASDGLISGTPTATGTQTVNFAVADAQGNAVLSTVTITVAPKPLAIQDLVVLSKSYDGTTAATLRTDVSTLGLVGVVGTDDVDADFSAATATFDDASVGRPKNAAVSGIQLTGTDAANYTLSQPFTLAALNGISQKGVSINGLMTVDRVYDGTNLIMIDYSNLALDGVVDGENVSINQNTNAYVLEKGRHKGGPTGFVGDDLPVDFSAVLTGNDKDNYYIMSLLRLTVNITPAPLTVSGITAADKIADGTTAAIIDSRNAELEGVMTFEQRTRTDSDGIRAAPDAAAPLPTMAADPVEAPPSTKIVYDDVALDTSSAVGTFVSAAVGTGVTVDVTGLTLTGTSAGNYTLTPPTPTADITPATATIEFSELNPTYTGEGLSPTVTTSPSGLNISLTFDDRAAIPVAGGTYTVSATINDDTYQGSLTASFTIAAAAQTLAVTPPTALSVNHDTALVATASSGLPVTFAVTAGHASISGNTLTPLSTDPITITATQAGNQNYASVSTTLEITDISSLAQTISFPTLADRKTDEPTVSLNAAATSGLPVSYTVVSGPATVSGNTATLTGVPGTVVIQADQTGNSAYAAATAVTQSFEVAAAAQPQSITFAGPPDQQSNSPAFDLEATATSELPVTFTIVSGPAMLSGRTLTPTGATGTVTVRADQAGNREWEPAAPVTRTFEISQVGPLVYFGATSDGTEFAVNIPEGSTVGTLFGQIAATGQFYILTFQVEDDRSITALRLQVLGDPQTTARALAQSPLRTHVGKKGFAIPTPAADELAYSFTGTLVGGVLNFTIAELGITLTGTVEPADGETASLAGLYESSSLNSANGTTTSIVGTSGKVFVLAITPSLITGGSGAITGDGTFSLQTATAVTISGHVDAPATTVSGTITLPDGAEDDFAGLSTGTLRTDRLINLSTRARIDRENGGTLITGFVVGGETPKNLLFRAVGPTLADFGVTTALDDPRIVVYDATSTPVATSDDWGGAADIASIMARIGAFPLPADSTDAVIVTTLDPGPYTMHVLNRGDPGIAIAEIYDASENPNSQYQRLVNISSRGNVTSGEGVLVGGFIVTGNSPKRILVRGIGPALAEFGVTDALADPQLKVYNQDQQVVATNDDWNTPATVFSNQRTATVEEIISANTAVGAFALEAASEDAALIITLRPGAYTVEVGSADSGTGNALIEIYEIPE